MPKNLHHKEHSNNRMGNTAMSIGPETSSQTPQEKGKLTTGTGFIPTYEDIQMRAYKIHEEKGGSELENWLEAERLLKEGYQG